MSVLCSVLLWWFEFVFDKIVGFLVGFSQFLRTVIAFLFRKTHFFKSFEYGDFFLRSSIDLAIVISTRSIPVGT